MTVCKVLFILAMGAAVCHGAVIDDYLKIFSDIENQIKDSTFPKVIAPGTKWCGNGNIAENNDDLGFFKKTDMCCRDHDLCDDKIPAGETKHGLSNDGTFTRLHCNCDIGLFHCLKDADRLVSDIVGTTYFNALGDKCYNETHPATCVKHHSILGFRNRCIEYSFDETRPKKWQWFDVPRYID